MISRATICLTLLLLCWSNNRPAIAKEWAFPGYGREDVGDFGLDKDYVDQGQPESYPAPIQIPESYPPPIQIPNGENFGVKNDPSKIKGGSGPFDAAGSSPSKATVENLKKKTTIQEQLDQDPDTSNERLLLSWDEWHKRVAEAIFIRFDAYAQKAFTRPLSCQAAYTVTRDRQITNVRLLQKSPNTVFNSMLLLVLKSMNGNPILDYPAGSQRLSVEKTGTFAVGVGRRGGKHVIIEKEVNIDGKKMIKELYIPLE